MELVAGATGIVGKQIALKLRREGRRVRAMVRGGRSRPEAAELIGAGMEIADADVTQRETLVAACSKIENVICTITSMPQAKNDGLRRVDHDGVLALIDAAEKAGVKKFIYSSYSGNIRIDSPLETAKRDCENRLLKSRMESIILRPSYFMEMWLSPALGFDPEHAKAQIFGSGDAPGCYISGSDVAAFAVAAVTRTEGKTILELGGPDELSQHDVVRLFENTLNKKFTLTHVPVEALEQQHQSPDPLQKTFAALSLCYAKGDVIPGSRETAKRFGIRLRSVADYAASFR